MKKIKQTFVIFISFKFTALIAYYIYISLPLNLLHFEHMTMEDIQFNDIFYSTKTHDTSSYHKNITLINTGSIKNDSLFRYKLGLLINRIAKLKPKKIGLDLIFENPKNNKIDSFLKGSIIDNKVVTILDFKNNKKNIFKSSNFGIANFPGKTDETQREYFNYIILNKDTVSSFASKLVDHKKGESVEYLNYTTSGKGFFNFLNQSEKIKPENFPAIEGDYILKENDLTELEKIIRGKIIIIGHLGNENMENEFDIEDKFRVPTDYQLFNRNLTMPGIVIHANAAQMILNNNYFYKVEGWLQEILTDVILFIFLFIFLTVHHTYTLSKLINILIILASTIPIIFIFCIYFMNNGIYFKIGGLFMQIAFLEEFIDIADGFKKKFIKN
jgi:CHASE2 domain-containing sensor protein